MSKKSLKYPDDFKLAVMTQFPHDTGMQNLLDFGSREVGTILLHYARNNTVPFEASKAHQALTKKDKGSKELLKVLKRDVKRIYFFVELLNRWKEIDRKDSEDYAQKC